MRSRRLSIKTADELLTYLRKEEPTKTEKRGKPQLREAAVWAMFRKGLKTAKWIATRLETWALPGVPDLLVSDPTGRLALVELKSTLNRRLNLSPHQAAFLSTYGRRGAPVWILARHGVGRDAVWYLFHGSHATRLALYPFEDSDPAAAGIWTGPQPPWDDVLALLLTPDPVSNIDRLKPQADRRIDDIETARIKIESAERELRYREVRAEVEPRYNAALPAPRAADRYTRD